MRSVYGDRHVFEWISLQFDDWFGFRFVWVDVGGLGWIEDGSG